MSQAVPLDNATLEKYAWNPTDRSMNVEVKDDDCFTLFRYPVAQTTDAIRGKVGFSRGFHVFKFTWDHLNRGTNAVIGFGTKDAPLHRVGYHSLIGLTADGYGWDLGRIFVFHIFAKFPSTHVLSF